VRRSERSAVGSVVGGARSWVEEISLELFVS
jgi:hypothetical protein